MKRIISERFVTYAANEKWPSTARVTIKMCDTIDQAMMQEALAATQPRYPYFCVRWPPSSRAAPCRLRPLPLSIQQINNKG